MSWINKKIEDRSIKFKQFWIKTMTGFLMISFLMICLAILNEETKIFYVSAKFFLLSILSFTASIQKNKPQEKENE